MMDEILEELKTENLYFDTEDKYKKALKKPRKIKRRKSSKSKKLKPNLNPKCQQRRK
jgi:hypothetical protein